MNDLTDQQLLRDYVERHSETAFTELVRRHVDLIHSAAVRLTNNTHSAQDITQAVFVALAQNAVHLQQHPVITGWLHTTARNLAAKNVRAAVRRQNREQEAIVMNELISSSPEASWEQIQSHLDAALGELSESDRDAVLLRYFEKKTAIEIAGRLGITDDAAQKRVSRALEKLREFFSKKKITVGASGLAVLISANAVQSAPVGLAVTISAAALAGTATTTSTLIATTTKAIAMTTLQKTLVTVTVAALAGAGIYEARQVAQLREQNQTLQQQQTTLTEQVEKLQREHDATTNQLGGLLAENSLIKSNPNHSELLKLRGEIGMLRNQLADAKNANKAIEQPPLATAREYLNRASQHSMNHEYEAQLDDLNHAIELDPTLAEAYMERGNLYSSNLPKEKGGYERAITDFTSVLELQPNDSAARWNRATYYRSLGRYDKAIKDWTTYIEGDTDFSRQLEGRDKSIAGALVWRGLIYQQNKKDYSKAIADYTAAIRMNPNAEYAYRSRGECYELLGDNEKAQQDFAIEPKRN